VQVGEHTVRYRFDRTGAVAHLTVDDEPVSEQWLPAIDVIETEIVDDTVFVSRGLYRLTDASAFTNPDLVVVAHKTPTAVVCLISALAFHGITTHIPHKVDIAVAPGARAPKLEHPPVQVYRFGGKSLTEGVEKHTIDGTSVRIFGAAKTVADCFKFRNRVGIDVAVEALRTHLRTRGRSVDELIRFAEIDRVRNVMMPYIEAIL
jgi:hypothetical protein